MFILFIQEYLIDLYKFPIQNFIFTQTTKNDFAIIFDCTFVKKRINEQNTDNNTNLDFN